MQSWVLGQYRDTGCESPLGTLFLSLFAYIRHHGPKHMESSHRPTPPLGFPCRVCNVGYPTGSALEQHYRDAFVHPKCTRCDLGFLDNTAMQTVSPF